MDAAAACFNYCNAWAMRCMKHSLCVPAPKYHQNVVAADVVTVDSSGSRCEQQGLVAKQSLASNNNLSCLLHNKALQDNFVSPACCFCWLHRHWGQYVSAFIWETQKISCSMTTKS